MAVSDADAVAALFVGLLRLSAVVLAFAAFFTGPMTHTQGLLLAIVVVLAGQ